MQQRLFFFIRIVLSLWGLLRAGGDAWAFSLKPPILTVSEAPERPPQNTFQGDIDQVGRGFVVVNGRRFAVAADVRVTDEEDGVLERGMNALKQQMKVELTLAGQTVVRIKVFGLLMR